MTLEELKAAWDAALEALKTKPEDAELVKAAADAEAAYKAEEAKEDPKEGEEDDPPKKKWDPETEKYIKKLRDENARNRTGKKESDKRLKDVLKVLGVSEDSEDPTEKLKASQAETNNLAFRTAILESAIEQGIPADQLEFYEFLISKATSQLDEGEELSDEALAEIVGKVKKAKGSANSSVSGGKDGKGDPPPGDDKGDISLDQFCRMTITQKSDLYLKKPDLYKRLKDEAKSKKRLV